LELPEDRPGCGKKRITTARSSGLSIEQDSVDGATLQADCCRLEKRVDDARTPSSSSR
jgi:hypothetical protein